MPFVALHAMLSETKTEDSLCSSCIGLTSHVFRGRLWIGQNGTRLQYVTQAARSACGLSDLIKVGPFPAAILIAANQI